MGLTAGDEVEEEAELDDVGGAEVGAEVLRGETLAEGEDNSDLGLERKRR